MSSDRHSYGLDEWQVSQLQGLTPEQLVAEDHATTVDEYRAKVETEYKRRRWSVPDAPAPKRKRKATK